MRPGNGKEWSRLTKHGQLHQHHTLMMWYKFGDSSFRGHAAKIKPIYIVNGECIRPGNRKQCPRDIKAHIVNPTL